VPETFRVGLTRDFLKVDGSLAFRDIGLELLERAPGVTWECLPLTSQPTAATSELQAVQARNYDALLVLAPSVSAATLAGNDRLAIVAVPT
jgi:hypothetical protein